MMQLVINANCRVPRDSTLPPKAVASEVRPTLQSRSFTTGPAEAGPIAVTTVNTIFTSPQEHVSILAGNDNSRDLETEVQDAFSHAPVPSTSIQAPLLAPPHIEIAANNIPASESELPDEPKTTDDDITEAKETQGINSVVFPEDFSIDPSKKDQISPRARTSTIVDPTLLAVHDKTEECKRLEGEIPLSAVDDLSPNHSQPPKFHLAEEQLTVLDPEIKLSDSKPFCEPNFIAKVTEVAEYESPSIVPTAVPSDPETRELEAPDSSNGSREFQWTFKGQADIMHVKKIGVGGFGEIHMVC